MWRGPSPHDEGLRDVVCSGTAVADPGADHTVHVDVQGLEPATTYYYAFETQGASSFVARTRTLPDRGVEHVRFAVASSASYNAGFFNAYARIAERDDIEFLLHFGDYIYEDAERASTRRAATARHRATVRPAPRVRHARRLPPPVRAVSNGSRHASSASATPSHRHTRRPRVRRRNVARRLVVAPTRAGTLCRSQGRRLPGAMGVAAVPDA